MDKSAGLPVYQPINMTGSDGLGHHHTMGGNPATVQAQHPSVYHQAILQQLQQQQQQQQQQQSFLPATCKLCFAFSWKIQQKIYIKKAVR